MFFIVCCERLTYRNYINVEVGHFSIHFVPSPEDPVTEDDITNVMCNTLDTCQEKMTELYENFKGAISERTEDEAETPQVVNVNTEESTQTQSGSENQLTQPQQLPFSRIRKKHTK